MGVVRKIRRRGATITVESHAEILFMPGGKVHNWANKFTGQLRARTIRNTPTNERPRWGHYGKPMKDTIVSARPRFWANGRDKQRVYAAVGSTAPYAYYVDQGTGVFGGSGPYPAKVLPPRFRGAPDLYESTWKPGGPIYGKPVAPRMIKGQEGQEFFDKSLRETMHHMRLSAFQVPTSPKISEALADGIATGLPGFSGNTPNDAGFKASLKEWRAWRDASWRGEAGPWGGRGPSRNHKARARARAANRKKYEQNRARYLASVAAAERRRKAENARYLAQKQARERAKQRAKEREAERKAVQAKNRARAEAAKAFEKARYEAYQYMHAIEKAYPDAQVQISKDRSMIRVHYTGPDGKPHNEYFLR